MRKTPFKFSATLAALIIGTIGGLSAQTVAQSAEQAAVHAAIAVLDARRPIERFDRHGDPTSDKLQAKAVCVFYDNRLEVYKDDDGLFWCYRDMTGNWVDGTSGEDI